MKTRLYLLLLVIFSNSQLSLSQSEQKSPWSFGISASAGVNSFRYSTSNSQLKETVAIQDKNSLPSMFQSVQISAYRSMKKHQVGAGLGWSGRKEKINENELPEMLNYSNQFQSCDIFIEDQYHYSILDERSAYLGIGLSGSFLYSAKSNYRALGMNQGLQSNISQGLCDTFGSVFMRWGMDWNIHANWKMGGFVVANYGFSNWSLNDDWKMQPIGLLLGFRFLKSH